MLDRSLILSIVGRRCKHQAWEFGDRAAFKARERRESENSWGGSRHFRLRFPISRKNVLEGTGELAGAGAQRQRHTVKDIQEREGDG